jgi:hypothetical protein
VNVSTEARDSDGARADRRLSACNGCDVAQAVIMRPLTATTRFEARVKSCGICGG